MKKRRIRKLVKKYINAFDDDGAKAVSTRRTAINAMNANQLKTALLNVDGDAAVNKLDAFPNDARETAANAAGVGQNKAIHEAAIVIAAARLAVGDSMAGLFVDIQTDAGDNGAVDLALDVLEDATHMDYVAAPENNDPMGDFPDYKAKYDAIVDEFVALGLLVTQYEGHRDTATNSYNEIKDFTPTANVTYGDNVLVTDSFAAARQDVAELTNNTVGTYEEANKPMGFEAFDLSAETDKIGAVDADGDGTLRARLNALQDPDLIPDPA